MYKQRDFETLWAKYEGLLKSLKNENINKLLDEQGQRIIMTSLNDIFLMRFTLNITTAHFPIK